MLIALAACHRHETGQPGLQWRRVRKGAEPVESARETCKTEAFKHPGGLESHAPRDWITAAIFTECMRRRGWAPATGDR